MNKLKKRQISTEAECHLSVLLRNRIKQWIHDRSYFRSLFPSLFELSTLTPWLEDVFETDYLEFYYGLD